MEPVKKALEAEDYEAMKSSLDSLNEKMQAAATEMYSQAQQARTGCSADSAEEPVGEKTASDVESGFEIVDEDEDKNNNQSVCISHKEKMDEN